MRAAWFVCLFVLVVHGLDVSWIPSDPDGPLPLSANYRKELSKLCHIIKSGKPLPKKVHNSKEIVYKMCQKLEASNDISSDTSSSSLLLYLILAAIGCYFLYSNMKVSFKGSFNLSTSVPSSSSPSIDTAALAREARLKKFERVD
jgi:hypothetical protein